LSLSGVHARPSARYSHDAKKMERIGKRCTDRLRQETHAVVTVSDWNRAYGNGTSAANRHLIEKSSGAQRFPIGNRLLALNPVGSAPC
jgi:hypothetical protein